MTRLIINGCNGRMGQALAQACAGLSDFKAVAGVDIFPEAAKHPFPVYGSITAVTEEADAIVDFSRQEALSGYTFLRNSPESSRRALHDGLFPRTTLRSSKGRRATLQYSARRTCLSA